MFCCMYWIASRCMELFPCKSEKVCHGFTTTSFQAQKHLVNGTHRCICHLSVEFWNQSKARVMVSFLSLCCNEMDGTDITLGSRTSQIHQHACRPPWKLSWKRHQNQKRNRHCNSTHSFITLITMFTRPSRSTSTKEWEQIMSSSPHQSLHTSYSVGIPSIINLWTVPIIHCQLVHSFGLDIMESPRRTQKTGEVKWGIKNEAWQ